MEMMAGVGVGELPLAEKVAFLSRGEAYPHSPPTVTLRETHMSWVFLAGDRVCKLKKPVRFPYLDFSSLERREAACRAELRLNRRLARDVYLNVVPLTLDSGRLAIDGKGTIVDWLVMMRRLDESETLEHAIKQGQVRRSDLDHLVAVLARFYRTTERVFTHPDAQLKALGETMVYNRRILLDPRLGMPAGLVRQIDRIQHRFVAARIREFRRRVTERQIVDAHGDLRPEHIWLGDEPVIIDCLEFNAKLRAIDPLDEIAFLSLECQRLGSTWAGGYISRRLTHYLRDGAAEPLLTFYRCYRAMLRARLAIAHLLEPNPRTPEKWPAMARDYLKFAAADARRLERYLRK